MVKRVFKLYKVENEILTLRYGTSKPSLDSNTYLTFAQIASFYHGVTPDQVKSFCHRVLNRRFPERKATSKSIAWSKSFRLETVMKGRWVNSAGRP